MPEPLLQPRRPHVANWCLRMQLTLRQSKLCGLSSSQATATAQACWSDWPVRRLPCVSALTR